jgi:hypothetical protein
MTIYWILKSSTIIHVALQTTIIIKIVTPLFLFKKISSLDSVFKSILIFHRLLFPFLFSHCILKIILISINWTILSIFSKFYLFDFIFSLSKPIFIKDNTLNIKTFYHLNKSIKIIFRLLSRHSYFIIFTHCNPNNLLLT